MKLLIATGIFPPEVGGPATYSKKLAEALLSRGHDVRVITYSDVAQISHFSHAISHVPIRQGNSHIKFRIFRITRSWFKPWHYYKYYRAVLRHGKWADLIYAQGPVSEGYPAYKASQKLKKPFVVKVVGDRSWEHAMNAGLTDKLIDEFQNLSSYPGKIQKMRNIQKQVCSNADTVITPSEYLKKIVSGWGVEESKIKVIYNAVDSADKRGSSASGNTPVVETSFTTGQAQIHADERVSPPARGGDEEGEGDPRLSAFTIVTSGRDVPWKGFKVVNEVVSELKQQYPDINLQILQNLPKDEYLQYLAAADLFILNTGYEGFSHALLEAMAIGVPAVATNIGGNPEVIKDGENGLLIGYNKREELKEALLKLYRDENLRTQFSQRGRETAKKFNIQSMIDQTEQILISLI